MSAHPFISGKETTFRTKSDRRESVRTSFKKKTVKHGYGTWEQKGGAPSKALKRAMMKIRVTVGKK